MPWRFRKTFAISRVLFSLTGRGLGASLRLLGFRVGRTSGGRRYVSFTIPRIGLTWVRYF